MRAAGADSAKKKEKKVIILFSDTHGFGSSIFKALQPVPDSDLTGKVSSLVIPVAEKYGLSCEAEVCQLAEFFSPDGSVQVSIFLLPNYTPPASICIVHELLILITNPKTPNSNEPPPMILIPYYIEPQKVTWERTTPTPVKKEEEVMVYGVEIVADATNTRDSSTLVGVLPRLPLPSTLRAIQCEVLKCLVHLIQVFKVPAMMIIGTGTNTTTTQNQNRKCNSDMELEVLCELGDFLANSTTGLSFAGDKILLKEHESVVESHSLQQKPWQALYG